ncbi:MAG: hypothetical protein L0H64_15320 [Pseudonocardia sp.]|nr:hypothetical protein [Pseudonocardia sp.]
MDIISKADLLARRFGVEDIEIPEVGTVKVRPLSRAEALNLQGKEMTVEEMERHLLSLALVEPNLTYDEVAQWQQNSPAGEIEPVADAIVRLSGMNKAAAKEAVQRFRGQHGS